MEKFSGDLYHMKSVDSIADTNQATLYTTEFLIDNSLNL